MQHKKGNKIFRYMILISFITFLALYLSQATGYFEYENAKKVALTNEQIKEFEKDVSEGKNIDIKKYLQINNKNYQNKMSDLGISISKVTEKAVQKTIGESFKVLSKLVGE